MRAQQPKLQTRPPNWSSPQRPTRTTFFASLITKLLVVSEPAPLPSPSQAEASAPLANPTPCTAKEGLFVGGRTVAQATMLEISSLSISTSSRTWSARALRRLASTLPRPQRGARGVAPTTTRQSRPADSAPHHSRATHPKLTFPTRGSSRSSREQHRAAVLQPDKERGRMVLRKTRRMWTGQAVLRPPRTFRWCPSRSAYSRQSPRTSNRPHNGLKLPAPGRERSI